MHYNPTLNLNQGTLPSASFRDVARLLDFYDDERALAILEGCEATLRR